MFPFYFLRVNVFSNCGVRVGPSDPLDTSNFFFTFTTFLYSSHQFSKLIPVVRYRTFSSITRHRKLLSREYLEYLYNSPFSVFNVS